eukprot:1420730-Pyramimonas_sp.AAC.1
MRNVGQVTACQQIMPQPCPRPGEHLQACKWYVNYPGIASMQGHRPGAVERSEYGNQCCHDTMA